MSADLISLGMSVVFRGDVRELREKLSMSRTTIAGLMGVSAESLRKWEAGQQGMKVDTALRIARWWQQLEIRLSQLDRAITYDELVPIVSVVAHLGVSQQKVMTWCRDGDIRYEDLGPLGYFIYKDQVPGLLAERGGH